ncbi:single-stranded DNA-binding protein [Nocardia sp. CS682]|uniref:single-stranded DNA-binding protein n=1 Tax=Nocardia sp. CS682 TaxID=1047172 RepID=UPI0010751869|nr:single-stranded DNA-binding protein [Nocardia sp. CS682]QBS44927.1 single-stranded DNA-binding protein [Nocardia sp. CS682]
MAGDLFITVIGNVTEDPEHRFTRSGKSVTTISVAQNARIFDRQANEWKNGDVVFMRCVIWEDLAENVVDSLRRGMRVIVYGKLKQRSYDTAEGEKRQVTELIVDSIGPDLRYAVAKVGKIDRRAVDPRDTDPAPESSHQLDADTAPADDRELVGVGADEEPPF